MHERYPLGSIRFEKQEALVERTGFTRENVGWASVLRGKALSRFYGMWTPKIAKTNTATPITHRKKI